MAADSISILSHPQALLTKRWFQDSKGHPKQESYGFAKKFAAQVIDLEGFDDMCELLDVLATEPKRCVIRGLPIAGRDLNAIYRRKNPKGDEPAGFHEVPHHWVMLDVDLKNPEVKGLYGTAKDCIDTVNQAIAILPMEMRTAGCWWQMSSSAGVKPGIRVHLWFWLDRPVGEAELTRWGEYANDQAGKMVVDTAVFRTVQPNYTANPVFDCVVDPVFLRCGKIPGPAVTLPRLAIKHDAWKRKLDPLKDPANENLHAPIRDACASYFCAKGPAAPDLELAQTLRIAVDYSCELRDVAETKYTDEFLQTYISGGRDFAREKASQADNLALGQDGTPKPTLDNIRSVLASTPEWAGVLGFNERRDRPVLLAVPPFEDGYKGNRTDTYPRDYTDTDDRRMSAWLSRKHQIQAPTHVIAEAVDVVARETSFDPIQDYLTSLVWDGVPRINQWLQKYFGVEDSSYTQRVGAMWLIQACARAIVPGAKADCVLCLEGLQGLKKKSTSLEALAGGLEYFREGIGDIRSNDTLMSMQSAHIVELRDMGEHSHREVEALKAFLDRRNDHFRSPYGRRPSDHYRRCVFAATTNKLSYLIDETGARRWWPVLTTKNDIEGIRADRDQLWAEAMARYRAGEHWWVEADDPDFVQAQAARYNGDERETDLAKALEDGAQANTLPFCTTPKIPPNAQAVRVTQVLEHVFNTSLKDQRRDMQMGVSKMLVHLGWTKEHTKAGTEWKRS